MNWLDYMIIIIVVLSAAQGLRHGLVRSLINMFGLLAGILVALVYYRSLAEYCLNRWALQDKLAPLTDSLLNLWKPVATAKNIFPPEAYDLLLTQLNNALVVSLASGLSFFFLLIVTVSLIGLAGRVLSSMLDLSLLGPFNHLGGLLFGLLKGGVFVLAILLLMTPFQLMVPNLAVPGNPMWELFPQGKAFADSSLIKYFQPLLDLIAIKAPPLVPLENIIPDDFSRLSI